MVIDIEQLIENFRMMGFDPRCFEDSNQAKKYLLEAIGESSVGIGGSMTIKELGLYESLIKNKNEVYWHWEGSEFQDADNADIYVLSANAVSMDGVLYFVDGVGNRVRNLLIPHDNVFVVFGTNKIVKNENSLEYRVETIAAPQNARRLNLNTPCAKLNYCTDCKSVDRMCTYYVKVKQFRNNIIPIIIDEELGF